MKDRPISDNILAVIKREKIGTDTSLNRLALIPHPDFTEKNYTLPIMMGHFQLLDLHYFIP